MFRLIAIWLRVCVNLQACLNAGVAELNKEKTEEKTFKPQTENLHSHSSLVCFFVPEHGMIYFAL